MTGRRSHRGVVWTGRVNTVAGAELHEVIGKLREDLQFAMVTGAGQRIGFELGPVEITLTVTVAQEGTGKAGVKFWVIDAGIEGKASKSTGQTIKLVLNPKDMLATPAADGSRPSPLVDGTADDDEAN